MDTKSVENELNAYPIKGFKFRVNEIEVCQEIAFLFPLITIRISAEYNYSKKVDNFDMVSWFYLALSDWIKKYNQLTRELEVEISESQMFSMTAIVKVREI